MKKIVFEQVGNIILFSILLMALIQTVNQAQIGDKDYLFKIKFGFWWGILLILGIIFLIARIIYQKYFGNHDGYRMKMGEFSVVDEREQLISYQATITSYKAVIIALVIGLIGFFFVSVITVDLKILKVTGILLLGSPIIVGFLTYLISWIVFDQQN